jgi:hypothetical protein
LEKPATAACHGFQTRAPPRRIPSARSTRFAARQSHETPPGSDPFEINKTELIHFEELLVALIFIHFFTLRLKTFFDL